MPIERKLNKEADSLAGAARDASETVKRFVWPGNDEDWQSARGALAARNLDSAKGAPESGSDTVDDELANWEKGHAASDVLVTKIMLGVFGCVPAFDRYIKDGFGSPAEGMPALTFGAEALHRIGSSMRAGMM